MIKVTVAYATPQQQLEIPLTVEENCTAQLAIQRSHILTQFPEIKLQKIRVGIFGKRVGLDARLHDGDRVEIYRALMIDPKEARRKRARA